MHERTNIAEIAAAFVVGNALLSLSLSLSSLSLLSLSVFHKRRYRDVDSLTQKQIP